MAIDVSKDFMKDLFSLEGRVAIVTGATGALGGAVAMGYALAGAKVIATARSEKKLQIVWTRSRPPAATGPAKYHERHQTHSDLRRGDDGQKSGLYVRHSRITFTTDMDSDLVRRADFVVETVFEDMGIKRETFAKLEERCCADAIFCTNSSVMSPSEISRELKYRERFVGTHFWNPAHLIPLVEVVKSDASSDETARTVMEVLSRVGKKPVLCKKDVPGFIANRMQRAL